MAEQAPSFDDLIQEGRRKKAAEKLAQEIFGKNRRSSAPPNGPKAANLGASLASRVGVNKRNSSLSRSTTPRQPRGQLHNRQPPANENYRPRFSHTQSATDVVTDAKSDGYATDDVADGGAELSIKGAASGPYVVVAQNFAPGTTAADIESVMLSVGGQMTSCKLVSSNPTVIAEMSFVDRSGAEKVIETFNGKKADGRPLYVYWKHSSGAMLRANGRQQAREEPPPPPPAPVADEAGDVVMEVDENARSREAENRLREERRGRDDRGPRDSFPTGPRGFQGEMDRYDDRRLRRPEPNYRDNRFGYGGGYRDGPAGPRGRYDRGRYGERSWRP